MFLKKMISVTLSKKIHFLIMEKYNEELIDGIDKYWGKYTFLSLLSFETIEKNKDYIDNNISKYLENWTIDRLGLTDQAIIRISVYELLYTNTPNLVCINEAIELSKKYSDEKVSKMINGVLDKIYHEVEDKSE